MASCSCGVFPLSGSVATLPVTQACVGTFVVLECQCEGLSVDELFSALFDARSCFHEERTALGVSNLCCAVAFSEVVNKAFNQGVRRLCESWDQLIEEDRYAEDE